MGDFLFLFTIDKYFYSHRYLLAQAVQNAGYQVHLACLFSNLKHEIQKNGFITHSISFHRGGINPFKELHTLFQIFSLYAKLKPTICHHTALKPVLYGGIVARFLGLRSIHYLGGVGFAFTARTFKAKIIKNGIKIIFKLFLNTSKTVFIVQNNNDYDLIKKLAPKTTIYVIPGTGVDESRFFPRFTSCQNSSKPLTFILLSRMLLTKGISEYMSAATIIRKAHPATRFLLVGSPDADNPMSVSIETLQRWHEEGFVEWISHSEDVATLYHQCDVAVLPSYREGLPKSLLEAMACGLSLLTTDVPGCRDLVVHKRNGYLAQPYSVASLVEGMKFFCNKSFNEIEAMGLESLAFYNQRFCQKITIPKLVNLYTQSNNPVRIEPNDS